MFYYNLTNHIHYMISSAVISFASSLSFLTVVKYQRSPHMKEVSIFHKEIILKIIFEDERFDNDISTMIAKLIFNCSPYCLLNRGWS